MKRRRGVSLGTISMIVFACVVLASTYLVMSSIRKDEGDLSMDAEMLLDSVGELFAISQRHIAENHTPTPGRTTSPKESAAVSTTPAPIPTQVQQVAVSPVTPAPTAVPHVKHTFSMTFGGSIMLESSVVSGAKDKKENVYRYDSILSGISSAINADMDFAIVETLFSADSIANKDLVAPAESLSAISSAGFDVAVLCGQNALSGGEACVRETLSAFRSKGMKTSGLYTTESSQRFDMLQMNGVSAAVLTYTNAIASTGKKMVADAQTRSAMIHLYDPDAARADIAAARSQGAQVVIVFLHTDTKDANEPSTSQRKNAQQLADAGADILIGFGGRNVQHVEMLASASDPLHRMLTAWSLGTLVCEDRDTRGVVSGALLHLQLTHDATAGTLQFDKVEYTPTYCWRQEENGIYPFRVIKSNQSVPEGMIQKQREIVARALVLIQNTMEKGIAVQR